MALPRFFVLKSNYNNKFLQYIDINLEVRGFLQFSGEDDSNKLARYEIVKAKSGNGLVHISCCYINKYWVRQSPSHWWITAGANEQEEDPSKWSCTLFEPIYVDADAKTIRFRHVQLGHYACLWRIGPPFGSCLFAGSAEQDKGLCDVCTIIDWELISANSMSFKGDILPKLIVLKANHNNKYLHYINEDEHVHGFLRFSGEEISSPFGKYEVEMAKCGNGLVHIRCCYNNKYWVRSARDHWWIGATAPEPEENKNIWSCTLFEPLYVKGDPKTIRFRHVQLGHYACLSRASDLPFNSCLYAGSKEPDDNELCDVCVITDWDSLLILPKHIAFKGDNGKYLSVSTRSSPYLEFASTNKGDQTVGNEVFINRDGSVRIKSNHLGKFWRRNSSSSWISADADDSTSDDTDTWFWPVKVEHNVIALRNIGNNNFCKRLAMERKMSWLFSCLNPGKKNRDYLNAAVSAIYDEAKLEVDELVRSRDIQNVKFRLQDARIYDQTPLVIASENIDNSRNPNPITVNLKLTKTETKSRTWNASASLKLGIETNIQTGIPSIAQGTIKVSGEFNGAYQWGNTTTETIELGSDHQVNVPPNTAMEVSLQATTASCDVPFSYSQCDTLINGEKIRYHMDDGIFTGNSFFDLKFITRQRNH